MIGARLEAFGVDKELRLVRKVCPRHLTRLIKDRAVDEVRRGTM